MPSAIERFVTAQRQRGLRRVVASRFRGHPIGPRAALDALYPVYSTLSGLTEAEHTGVITGVSFRMVAREFGEVTPNAVRNPEAASRRRVTRKDLLR